MDSFAHFSKSQFGDPLRNLVDEFLLGSRTAQEWVLAREQATAILRQHTAELRDLMAQMQTFTHETSVETVMTVQSRTAALRWLIQSIEQEAQRLDKAYREAAQMEQFRRDRATILT